MEKFFRGVILVLVLLWAGALMAAKWQCPMHPQVVQAKPGSCPICHMDLEKAPEGPGNAQGERKDADLKRAAFALDERRRQLIGVKSEAVAVLALSRTLRLPAQGLGGRRLLAQLPEADLGLIKAGVRARVLGLRGQEAEARVEAVESRLDPVTRSFAVALRAQDSLSWLPEGGYAEVRVLAALGKVLALPLEALIDTGLEQVVFVEGAEGHYEPRSVSLGARGDDHIQVLSGLEPGERVVVQALFLIDSESRFRAAARAYGE